MYVARGALFCKVCVCGGGGIGGWGEGIHLNTVLALAHLEQEQNWMKIGITLAFWSVRGAIPAAGWQFVTSAPS